jgi:hypothetical protein
MIRLAIKKEVFVLAELVEKSLQTAKTLRENGAPALASSFELEAESDAWHAMGLCRMFYVPKEG